MTEDFRNVTKKEIEINTNCDEMNHFKFRAECETDVDKLRKRMGLKCNRIVKDIGTLPDTDVDLYTTLSLVELRNEMRSVEDGHVMFQTVSLAKDYTGERDYELE